MTPTDKRLDKLEDEVNGGGGPVYYCEETETEIIFGGPDGCVVLPRKDPADGLVVVVAKDGRVVSKTVIGGIAYGDI